MDQFEQDMRNHMKFDKVVRQYIQEGIKEGYSRVQILESFNKYIVEEMSK